MADSSVTNVYKVLGGVLMGQLIGLGGASVGGAVGYGMTEKPIPEGEVPMKAFYGACIGSAVAHAGSMYMGHSISKTPENKTMGNAQLVFSAISIGLSGITAFLGNYIIEQTPQLTTIKAFTPYILIGKSPTKRMAGMRGLLTGVE